MDYIEALNKVEKLIEKYENALKSEVEALKQSGKTDLPNDSPEMDKYFAAIGRLRQTMDRKKLILREMSKPNS